MNPCRQPVTDESISPMPLVLSSHFFANREPKMIFKLSKRASIALPWLLLLSISGCGKAEQKFYPQADYAQEALETALEKWKSGAPHATITDFQVPIDMFDTRWQTKKKLESFEIQGEEKSEGPRVFKVKMKVAGEKEESEVKYLIVGKDPLQIFHEQEFNKGGM